MNEDLQRDKSQSAGVKPDSALYPFALIVCFSVVLVLALCWGNASSRSLWLDELFSLLTAEEPVLKMLHLLSEYKPWFFDHPPLYFILLRYVLYFDNSPIALRLPSMLMAGLAIGLWGVLLYKRKFSLSASLAFVVFSISNPMICFQAVNARMYSLFLLLSALCFVLLDIIDSAERRERRYIIFALGALLAAGVYTSYFGVLFGIGVGALALVNIAFPSKGNSEERKGGARLMISCAIGAILTTPWLPTIFRLLGREQAGEPYSVSRAEQMLRLFVDLGGSAVALAWAAAGALILLTVVRKRETLLSLALFVIMPILLLLLMTPQSRPVNARYIIFSVPVLAFASVFGWQWVFRRIIKKTILADMALAVMLIVVSLFNFSVIKKDVFKKVPDWKAAAEIIEKNARADEIILTGGFLSGEAMTYHLKHPEKFSFIHYVTDMDKFYLSCKDKKIIWYVNAAPLPLGYKKIVEHYFPYHISFAGNAGLGDISVYSKKPFLLPWGMPAEYFPPQPLDFEKSN